MAAGFCTATLGEDSAGSIRNPASLAGLVGVIGTYGRVSRYGLASMGWTVDHCGPLTWTAKDAAYVLEAISGFDPRDPKSSREPVPQFSAGIDGGVAGLKIGVPRVAIESSTMNVQPEVLAAFNESVDMLRGLGAEITEVELPLVEESTFLSFVIYTGEYFAEYMSQLEWFSAGHRESRLPRMGLGALTSAGDYLHAQKLRAHMRAEFKKIFGEVDLLATPLQGSTAALKSEMAEGGREWWKRPGFAAMFNVTGLPALTVPGGFDSKGLPIGLQLGGRPFDEATMFRAAHAYEQSTLWHTMRAVL
jgi:aspartyl-tRNA(Asn)/glutamyl-tRNA(Gln) amidotransferase subunit A